VRRVALTPGGRGFRAAVDERANARGIWMLAGAEDLIDRDGFHSEAVTEVTQPTMPTGAAGRAAGSLRPRSLRRDQRLFWRRVFVIGLNLLTVAAVVTGVALVLATGGWTLAEAVILGCVFLSAPWTVLGFWNAVIGTWLMVARRDPVREVAEFWLPHLADRPINSPTAITMTIRNEDPERAFARILAIRQSLDETGYGNNFDVFVLSDTDDPQVADREEAVFADHRHELDGNGRAFYRRRSDRAGFKAGNVWNFVQRWGADYDFMVPLDADSAMSGPTIKRLVAAMEANPRIGILQSLVVGSPSLSAFARLFQFGMRHGMRSFTLGSAWWQSDCGPFWGHNAVIRVQPFKRHCDLPVLQGRPPLGGHLLSHDQIEAVLMRRGGYDVRVVPVESESWEENPVTLIDYMQRDQRWCNGNMQYWSLLGMRGLPFVSRAQLIQAVMMYLASPAWMLMVAMAIYMTLTEAAGGFNHQLAIWLFVAMMFMSLAPKIAGGVFVFFNSGEVARYGGRPRFLGAMLIEIVFSMLIAPIVAFRISLFLIGLLFGRKISWGGQSRDAYTVTFADALRNFWAPTAFGAIITGLLVIYAPSALPWALPVVTGLLVSIPLAIFSSSSTLGWLMARYRIAAVPEELATPKLLISIDDWSRRIAARRELQAAM